MKVNVGVSGSNFADELHISFVVSPDDMNRALAGPFAEMFDHKWRAKIPAMDHHLGPVHLIECLIQSPDVVMSVRENGNLQNGGPFLRVLSNRYVNIFNAAYTDFSIRPGSRVLAILLGVTSRIPSSLDRAAACSLSHRKPELGAGNERSRNFAAFDHQETRLQQNPSFQRD